MYSWPFSLKKKKGKKRLLFKWPLLTRQNYSQFAFRVLSASFRKRSTFVPARPAEPKLLEHKKTNWSLFFHYYCDSSNKNSVN